MERPSQQPSRDPGYTAADSHSLATSESSILGSLASWTDSRLPLSELLRAVAEEYPGRSRNALGRLADRLDQGDTLEQAFDTTRMAFSRGLRQPLALAAASGNLQTALPALAVQEATRRDVRRQITSSLLYPISILLFSVLLALLASWMVIPQFATTFDEFELDLPAITELVIEGARWLPTLIAVAATVAFVAGLLWVTPSVRWLAHWLASAAPLFGTLWIWISHHALCEQLAAYLSAQTPLPAALRGVASGLSNRSLAGAVEKIAASCEQGVPLSQAMDRSIHFERMLTTMVRWGESSESLPKAFSEASQVYRRQIENYLIFIRRISAPCMIVTVGAGVFLVTTALFLPMISLIEALT